MGGAWCKQWRGGDSVTAGVESGVGKIVESEKVDIVGR